MKKASVLFKSLCVGLVVICAIYFLTSEFMRAKTSLAAELGLPSPTELLSVSDVYSLPVLEGLKLNPDNPFEIEFLIDTADKSDVSNDEISRLVSYFMAGVTTAKEDIWVNLSPYEQDRVIDKSIEDTDLGRDLMAQDYVLKQLSSSLTLPDTKTGDKYWNKLSTFDSRFSIGSTTSNKIWIKPDIASVYEKGNLVLVAESSLKVESEDSTNDVLLPEILKDINGGKNFARLRQIYSAMILSEWFKNKVKDSLYAAYVDSSKTNSLELEEKGLKDKIYSLYLKSFKNGVYDLIKTKYNDQAQKKQKRAYFSGGFENELNLDSAKSYAKQDKTICSAVVKLDTISNSSSIAVPQALAITAMTLLLTLPNNSYAGRRARRKAAQEAAELKKTPLERHIPGMVELKKNYLKYSSISEDYNQEKWAELAAQILNIFDAYLADYLAKDKKQYELAFELLVDYTDLMKAYGESKAELWRNVALDKLINNVEQMISNGQLDSAKNELLKYKYHFMISGRINDYTNYEKQITQKQSSSLGFLKSKHDMQLPNNDHEKLVNIFDSIMGDLEANIFANNSVVDLKRYLLSIIIAATAMQLDNPIAIFVCSLFMLTLSRKLIAPKLISLKNKINRYCFWGYELKGDFVVSSLEQILNKSEEFNTLKADEMRPIIDTLIEIWDDKSKEMLTHFCNSNALFRNVTIEALAVTMSMDKIRFLKEIFKNNELLATVSVHQAQMNMFQLNEFKYAEAIYILDGHFDVFDYISKDGRTQTIINPYKTFEEYKDWLNLKYQERTGREIELVHVKDELYKLAPKQSSSVDAWEKGGVDMDSLNVEVEGSSSSLFAFHKLPCAVENFAGFSFDIKAVVNNVPVKKYLK